MLELLIWILVGTAIWRCASRGGCARRRLEPGGIPEPRRLPRARSAGRHNREPAAPVHRPVTPEGRAREAMRLYVEGRISVEEYEAELDRAYGLR